MFRKSLALLFLGFISSLFSQEKKSEQDSLNISFIAYWSKGDIYKYNITKIKKKDNDGVIKIDSINYKATFEVIDSTATSYKIKWSYKNDFFNTYKVPKKLLHKFEKYSMQEVIYNTTETGEFVSIDNWEKISDRMKS